MKPKILYVDDEVLNLQLFTINFSKKFQVITADNPFTGLEILDEISDIKFIISDLKMPGMNGMEFVQRAKAKFPAKYYYILSGFEITENVLLAMENKIILKYFMKPYNVKEIESILSDEINS